MMRLTMVAVLAVSLSMTAFAEEWWPVGAKNVIGHKYVLTQVDGKDFASEREVFVQFGEDHALSGAVCNRFSGVYEMRGSIIKAENLASTRMLCPDGNLSTLENTFFRHLRDGVSVTVREDSLEMRRDDSIWIFRKSGDKTADAAAAAVPASASEVAWKDLAGRKFTLAMLDGEPFKIEMGKQPFIEFGEDGRVFGSACNGFNGPAELKDGVLSVENAAATMMMCIDEKLVRFERDFHRMLREGFAVSVSGKTLTLKNGDRVLVYEE